MDDKDLLLTIEELALNSWPALVSQQLEGWRLRAANGVSRRGNSVFAGAPMPRYERWHDEVRDFYRRHGLPSRFYVSDASPEGLDDMLAGRGYEAEAPTVVQVAPCSRVLDVLPPSPGFQIRFFDRLEPEWLEAFIQAEGHEAWKKETYGQIMAAIGPRKVFVLAEVDGRPAGVGSSVAERGWAGLFNLATVPAYRGKGIAAQITRELTTWAQSNGAENLYLQVMENNAPALRLYERWGFTRLYGYHYRTLVRPT